MKRIKQCVCLILYSVSRLISEMKMVPFPKAVNIEYRNMVATDLPHLPDSTELIEVVVTIPVFSMRKKCI